MSFLESYKQFFNLYLLLGVCPFRVNLTKVAVECSLLPLCYSILLFSSVSIGILYFLMESTIDADLSEACDSGTCNYALIIQALVIFVLFVIQSMHTIFHRSNHVQLLNEMADMETNVMKHFGIEMFPKELVRRVCLRNTLLALVQFALNISAIYALNFNQTLDLTAYHYLFAVEILIIGLTVVHVIAICSILKQCSQLLLNEIKHLLKEQTSQNDDEQDIKLYQIFHFLDKINEFKAKVCSVFGIRLLVNQSMDFVLLTVAIYYFILVNVPLHFKFHWMQVYFLFVYVFPVIVKNFALVVATDTLGSQVSFGDTFDLYGQKVEMRFPSQTFYFTNLA